MKHTHLLLACLFFFMTMSCHQFGCQKSSVPLAPDTLSGKTLRGTVDSADGSLALAKGNQFLTVFDDSQHFHTQKLSGIIETTGTYLYSKTTDNTGVLSLRADSGDGAGLQLTLKLQWNNVTNGKFDGSLVNGMKGHENGSFTIDG